MHYYDLLVDTRRRIVSVACVCNFMTLFVCNMFASNYSFTIKLTTDRQWHWIMILNTPDGSTVQRGTGRDLKFLAPFVQNLIFNLTYTCNAVIGY